MILGMITWLRCEEKCVLIFKYLILFFTLIIAQKTEVVISSIDYENIKLQVDSLNNSHMTLSAEYHLSSFNSVKNQSIYQISDSYKTADSLIFNGENIVNTHIKNTILDHYRYTPVGKEYFATGKQLVSKYYFINEIPEYDFGLIGEEYLVSLITVDPNFNSYFTGSFGASKNSKTLDFIGQIDLEIENLIGEAEQTKIFWKRDDILSQKIKINTFMPHFFRLPFGLEWELNHELYRGLYTLKDQRLKFNVFIPFMSRFQLGYNWGEIIATDLGIKNSFKNLSYEAFTIGTELDTRNDRLQPTDGKYFHLMVDGGQDKNTIFIKSSVDCHSFHQIVNNFYLKFGYFIRGINYHNAMVPISRYTMIGGTNTLRGFEEKEFSSTQFQVLTLESIIQQSSLIQLKMFIDMGSDEINPFSKNMFGYGFGINQVNQNSIISVDYAIGNSKKSSSKIHIKWVTRF